MELINGGMYDNVSLSCVDADMHSEITGIRSGIRRSRLLIAELRKSHTAGKSRAMSGSVMLAICSVVFEVLTERSMPPTGPLGDTLTHGSSDERSWVLASHHGAFPERSASHSINASFPRHVTNHSKSLQDGAWSHARSRSYVQGVSRCVLSFQN